MDAAKNECLLGAHKDEMKLYDDIVRVFDNELRKHGVEV